MNKDSKIIVNITDRGLNIEGYTGPFFAITHETKQNVAPVLNTPCQEKYHKKAINDKVVLKL